MKVRLEVTYQELQVRVEMPVEIQALWLNLDKLSFNVKSFEDIAKDYVLWVRLKAAEIVWDDLVIIGLIFLQDILYVINLSLYEFLIGCYLLHFLVAGVNVLFNGFVQRVVGILVQHKGCSPLYLCLVYL